MEIATTLPVFQIVLEINKHCYKTVRAHGVTQRMEAVVFVTQVYTFRCTENEPSQNEDDLVSDAQENVLTSALSVASAGGAIYGQLG